MYVYLPASILDLSVPFCQPQVAYRLLTLLFFETQVFLRQLYHSWPRLLSLPELRAAEVWEIGTERVNMERKVVVVCGVVGFLGLLSAATGFAAEGTRIKVVGFPFHLRSPTYSAQCVGYGSDFACSCFMFAQFMNWPSVCLAGL